LGSAWRWNIRAAFENERRWSQSFVVRSGNSFWIRYAVSADGSPDWLDKAYDAQQ
jgi:hypothetical protein